MLLINLSLQKFQDQNLVSPGSTQEFVVKYVKENASIIRERDQDLFLILMHSKNQKRRAKNLINAAHDEYVNKQ